MFFMLLTIVISIVVALFALQNSEIVPIKFMFYSQEMSLVLVILGAAFLGMLLAASLTMYIKFQHFFQDRKKDGNIKELNDENVLLTKRVQDLEAQVAEMTHKHKDELDKLAVQQPVVQPDQQPAGQG